MTLWRPRFRDGFIIFIYTNLIVNIDTLVSEAASWGGMSPSLETGGTLPHGKIRSKRRKRSLFQESKSHFPPSTVVITTLYSVQYAKHHILSINSPISVDLIFCFQWFNFGLELFAEFCLDLIFLFYFV